MVWYNIPPRIVFDKNCVTQQAPRSKNHSKSVIMRGLNDLSPVYLHTGAFMIEVRTGWATSAGAKGLGPNVQEFKAFE
jgi:hypothetical protein